MSNAPTEDMSSEPDCLDAPCAAIERVIRPRKKDLGGGFSVRRVLPFHARKMVGPFVFFDHFGPVDYAPGEGFDVRPHPHIGLATVTYLFDGAIAHKDTVGSDLVIRPGAVNWMTAGRGIVHSERTPPEARASGQTMHGVQTWVALPKSHEDAAPAFEHHPSDTLPVFELGGAEARLIAGEGWGRASPVRFPWGIWYLAIDAKNAAAFEIPGDAAQERGAYLVEGGGTVAGETAEPGDMAVLNEHAAVEITLEPGSKLMLAGGQAMDGVRQIEWNLVASDASRIDRAKSDWRASIAAGFRDAPFALPEGESEWIPLPEDQ